jgi:hypothetical protein
MERDQVAVDDLAGERVGGLEGEDQGADQPDGENERGDRAHGATLARIAARAALESDAASDLQIGEAV